MVPGGRTTGQTTFNQRVGRSPASALHRRCTGRAALSRHAATGQNRVTRASSRAGHADRGDADGGRPWRSTAAQRSHRITEPPLAQRLWAAHASAVKWTNIRASGALHRRAPCSVTRWATTIGSAISESAGHAQLLGVTHR